MEVIPKKSVHIRDASPKDIHGILGISDSELGKGYLDESVKHQIVSDKTVFRVAESKKDGIIGFCYSYFTNDGFIAQDLSINKTSNLSKIAVLKTIAVKSSGKGKGVGSSLIKDTISQFKKREIESIYCVSWEGKGGINIGGLMDVYEFDLYEKIENFWTEDSKQKGYLCPECGNTCQCSAIIYTKQLR